MEQIIIVAIELVVLVGAFLIGKFLLPNLSSTQLTKLSLISTWAYKFVVSLKNTSGPEATGAEKKETVTGLLSEYATKIGVTLTDDQISALIEDAYDTMKKEQAKAEAEKAPTQKIE